MAHVGRGEAALEIGEIGPVSVYASKSLDIEAVGGVDKGVPVEFAETQELRFVYVIPRNDLTDVGTNKDRDYTSGTYR